MKRGRKKENPIKKTEIIIRTAGRKKVYFEGNIYSKKFWECLRELIQKQHGDRLPPAFRKLTEPITED